MTVNTFLEGFELKVDSSQLPACKQVLYVHFHIFKILIVVFFCCCSYASLDLDICD